MSDSIGISKPVHDKAAVFLTLSRMMERGGFFGLQTLIVLYLIEDIGMERSDAMTVFGLFTAFTIFFQLIGAVFGDFVIGNRKAILAAIATQVIGASLLCIPGSFGMYGGLLLFAMGSGAFGVNLAAMFGKLYLHRVELLDAGFTMLHVAATLGSAGGILIIGKAAETLGWTYGFALSGIFILIGLLPLLLGFRISRDTDADTQKLLITEKNTEWPPIMAIVLLVGLFSALLLSTGQLNGMLIDELYDLDTGEMPEFMWSAYDAVFGIPIGIGAVILWSRRYTTQLAKLAAASLIAALSLGVLLAIPEEPTRMHIYVFFFSTFILAIAEIFVAPLIQSALTQHANPKYLTTLMGLAFLPSAILASLVPIVTAFAYAEPSSQSTVGMASLVGIGLIIGWFTWKKTRRQ